MEGSRLGIDESAQEKIERLERRITELEGGTAAGTIAARSQAPSVPLADPQLSGDLLAGQLAELYGTYSFLQTLEGRDGNGPLDHEALPVPVALLAAAVEIKAQRASKELDAVRLLLRLLWQLYDAGGTSVGRSFQARIVEVAMILVGSPSSRCDVSTQGVELLKQCEDRAYDISRSAQNGSDWDAAVRQYRAAHERRLDAYGKVTQQP